MALKHTNSGADLLILRACCSRIFYQPRRGRGESMVAPSDAALLDAVTARDGFENEVRAELLAPGVTADRQD